jgi:hypothetical protein
MLTEHFNVDVNSQRDIENEVSESEVKVMTKRKSIENRKRDGK